MRKLVLSMGVSVDGLVARPGRYAAGGWRLPPEDAALAQRNRVDGHTGRTLRRRVHVYPSAAEAA